MFRHAAWLAILLGSIWVGTAASPQKDFVIRTWDARNGLAQDAVKAIAQTPDGYLWIATFGGLSRFDGARFQNFRAGNTHNLPDNLLNALFCDRKGRLWIGHDSGFVTVMERGNFRQITMPADWSQVPIRDFGEDAEGNVWVMNLQWQLAIINSAGKALPVPPLEDKEIPLHFGYLAKDGNLRLITKWGRCYVAQAMGLTQDPDAPPRASDGRRVICSPRGGYWAVLDGRLTRWMGGNRVEDAGEVNYPEAIYATTCEWNGMVAAGSFLRGLNLTGFDGGRWQLEAPADLPSNWISVLFVDRSGILWAGTGDGGIFAITSRRVRMIQPPGEAARKHILSITPGTESGIWVATEGSGLFEFNGESWRQTLEIPNVPSASISPILMAEDGRLWADVANKGLFFLQNDVWTKVFSRFRVAAGRGALLKQSNVLWAVSSQNLLRIIGDNSSKVEQMMGGGGACCLAPDGAGGVWFGGYGMGLGHWLNQEATVLHFKDGLPSENVHSLYRSHDGTLWIGTDGAGLVMMKNGQFKSISKANGLLSDSICQITEDEQGRLWMGTYDGICAASLKDLNSCAEGKINQLNCLMLDTSDGMEVKECSAGRQPAVCHTADGRL